MWEGETSKHQKHIHSESSFGFGILSAIKSINPILIQVYPRNGGGWIYPTLTAISPTPTLHLVNSWHPSPNQYSCSPSPLASFTSSLVILASSFPLLQTPMLFSKHAHHPSSTDAHTISSTIRLCHQNHCFLQSQHLH